MPPPDPLPFITDDRIVRELRIIVAALHHLESHIPSLARRAEDLLRQLEPRKLTDDMPAA